MSTRRGWMVCSASGAPYGEVFNTVGDADAAVRYYPSGVGYHVRLVTRSPAERGEGEPVGWALQEMNEEGRWLFTGSFHTSMETYVHHGGGWRWVPLYAAPPASAEPSVRGAVDPEELDDVLTYHDRRHSSHTRLPSEKEGDWAALVEALCSLVIRARFAPPAPAEGTRETLRAALEEIERWCRTHEELDRSESRATVEGQRDWAFRVISAMGQRARAALAAPPAPADDRCGAVTTLGGAFAPMVCTLPAGHKGRHDADSAIPLAAPAESRCPHRAVECLPDGRRKCVDCGWVGTPGELGRR